MLRRIALLVIASLVMAWPVPAGAQNPSADEAAVRKVLSDTAEAINKDDLALLLAQIADDAQIDSKLARGKVPKQRWGEVMAASMKRGEIISTEYRDVNVVMADATHATATGTIWSLI